jgi:hypothetical protein
MLKLLPLVCLFLASSAFAAETIRLNIPDTGNVEIVLQESRLGSPIGVIQDDKGKFFPEIQLEINNAIRAKALKGFKPTHFQIRSEKEVYPKSPESFAILVLEGTTVNGVTEREQPIKFAISIERMFVENNGGNAHGFGYWNATEVRIIN